METVLNGFARGSILERKNLLFCASKTYVARGAYSEQSERCRKNSLFYNVRLWLTKIRCADDPRSLGSTGLKKKR